MLITSKRHVECADVQLWNVRSVVTPKFISTAGPAKKVNAIAVLTVAKLSARPSTRSTIAVESEQRRFGLCCKPLPKAQPAGGESYQWRGLQQQRQSDPSC
jgi:hypothetical protein